MKDGYTIALKGKEAKVGEMSNEKVKEKNELAMTDFYLALNEVVLFKVFEETTTKGL